MYSTLKPNPALHSDMMKSSTSLLLEHKRQLKDLKTFKADVIDYHVKKAKAAESTVVMTVGATAIAFSIFAPLAPLAYGVTALKSFTDSTVDEEKKKELHNRLKGIATATDEMNDRADKLKDELGENVHALTHKYNISKHEALVAALYISLGERVEKALKMTEDMLKSEEKEKFVLNSKQLVRFAVSPDGIGVSKFVSYVSAARLSGRLLGRMCGLLSAGLAIYDWQQSLDENPFLRAAEILENNIQERIDELEEELQELLEIREFWEKFNGTVGRGKKKRRKRNKTPTNQESNCLLWHYAR